jgi:hypothetical protein
MIIAKTDNSIYFGDATNYFVRVAIYGDDMLVLASSIAAICFVQQCLIESFKMKDYKKRHDISDLEVNYDIDDVNT